MASLSDPYISPEAYLAQERGAQFKSEYWDGRIYAMSGGSEQHCLIAMNLGASLWQQLKGRPCRPYGSDMRIATSTGKRYFYPDLSVICGPTQFHDEHKDTAVNPTVIVEVLSESTAAYDRGPKFLSYQGIVALQEYLLVHADQPIVEHYLSRPDDSWIYQKVEGLTANLILTSIQCSLNLEEVYLSVFGLDIEQARTLLRAEQPTIQKIRNSVGIVFVELF